MIGAIIAVMLLIGGVIAAAALSARGSSDELAGNDGTKVADSRIGFLFNIKVLLLFTT